MTMSTWYLTFQVIESIKIKDFNEEKNLEYFSVYNLFDAYETKLKIRVWFISYFLYQRLQMNDKSLQYIVNLYFIFLFFIIVS